MGQPAVMVCSRSRYERRRTVARVEPHKMQPSVLNGAITDALVQCARYKIMKISINGITSS